MNRFNHWFKKMHLKKIKIFMKNSFVQSIFLLKNTLFHHFPSFPSFCLAFLCRTSPFPPSVVAFLSGFFSTSFWVSGFLRFRKKPRGALGRAFAFFWAQMGKMTNSLLPKKNTQITLDDPKIMFFQVYHQNHLNMA